jgi:hypothetical protein
MKKIIPFIFLVFVNRNISSAQGCVAIRATGSVCTKFHAGNNKGWRLNSSYRYFKSFRHFVGTDEQKERMENQTEVINWQHAFDLTALREFNSRWSLAVSVPIISNKRSSLYEHYGNNSTSPNARQNTRSFGIGDMRLTVYHWLFDPAKTMKWNMQVGLGVKFATGDYTYNDFFKKNDSTQVQGPVDQSIQLGDGGTGIVVELNTFYNISNSLSVYGSFYYLVNPREQNGTSTSRGGPVSANAIKYSNSTMSVPDQYMLRGGINFTHKHLTASAGVRKECIPSSDLVGGDGGFRRPGYVVSLEPGLSYSFSKITIFSTVPFALKRDRTQSYADKLQTTATGIYRHGDAAFADYSINLGCSIKL